METGNAEALNNVGWYYHNGIGVGADYAKALEYYTEAIRKGSVDALEEIGELYRDGLGVEQDYEKAADYFHKAMELGETHSGPEYDQLIEEGKIPADYVPKDVPFGN